MCLLYYMYNCFVYTFGKMKASYVRDMAMTVIPCSLLSAEHRQHSRLTDNHPEPKAGEQPDKYTALLR